MSRYPHLRRLLVDVGEMSFALSVSFGLSIINGQGAEGFAVGLATYGCWTAIRAASAQRAPSEKEDAA